MRGAAPRRRVIPGLAIGGAAIALGALLAAFPPPPVFAVSRDVARGLRDTYEGRTLRLRIDLHSAAHALEPNVLGLDGMGYGREGSPVLFHRLEMVFLERIVSEGGSRVSITIYRSETEARNLRANAIPAPAFGNPAAAQTTSAFARTGSTSVVLELKSGKKDPDAQRLEITTLLGRLFYLETEPSRDELEAFVLQHRDWPVARLAALTGLTQDEIRALTTGTPRPPE